MHRLTETPNMGHIRFISTTTVQPSSHIDQCTRRIELTPCDLQLLVVDYIQKGILFNKPQSDYENESIPISLIEHLKASFSQTLDIFYPLAGRLSITENDQDNTTSFSLTAMAPEPSLSTQPPMVSRWWISSILFWFRTTLFTPFSRLMGF